MDSKTLIIPLLGMFYKVYRPEKKNKSFDIGTVTAAARNNISLNNEETYVIYAKGTISNEFEMNINYMVEHNEVHLPSDIRIIITDGTGLTDQFIKHQIHIACCEIVRDENIFSQVVYAE